jgi:DNA-binding NtrC family response regulator
MKMGAYDYILKPIKIDEMQRLIEKALHYAQLLSENVQLKERLKKYEGAGEIITANPKMRALFETLKQVAATSASVLIEGESGTGKQLVAASVHYMSPRADNPFIEINCGAIPVNLLESELFGHEKGAFTGAVHTKKGKFELAGNGTLFLDEIGELPLELQAKLLHVLENQTFTRVGGTQFIKTNARIVAATNRMLSEEVEKKRFRSDLYYRLKVVYVRIPPLRERREDIPLLVRHFMEKYNQLHGDRKREVEMSEEALDALQSYGWPGNVRELENVIQQVIIFARDGLVTAEALPPEVLDSTTKPSMTKEELRDEKNRRTEAILRDIEYGFLKRILTKTRGNITRAAEISGYNRRQLQNLTKKYGMKVEYFK